MKNVRIVAGHPELRDNSFANKIILEDIKQLLPEAAIDDLSALYPAYQFDVAAEQKKLVAADIIVLQFPVFWFSMPALLAKWVEDVFLHGFSHGSTGKALVHKKLLLSFTTGAPESTYETAIPMDVITSRFAVTAEFTGMDYAGYIYTGNVSYADRASDARIAAMTAAAHAHAQRLAARIKELA